MKQNLIKMKNNSVLLLFLVVFVGFSQEKINQVDALGNRNGVWKGVYKDSNRPRYEGTFINGKEIGIFNYFDDTKEAIVIATRDFSKGDGSCYAVFYDQKRNKVSEGKLVNKDADGTWKYYHQQSPQLMSIEFYKKGKLDGNRKVYYKDGTIAEDTNYKAGIKEGISNTFSGKGKLIETVNYKKGQYDGLASYYDGSGSKMYEGNYANGKRVGNWKFFENNKLFKEVKANKFSKELISYEQRYTEKVSKTFEQIKKEQGGVK
jgi:antitoxin component YwqK of YwqJK toxin-antitoxin module